MSGILFKIHNFFFQVSKKNILPLFFSSNPKIVLKFFYNVCFDHQKLKYPLSKVAQNSSNLLLLQSKLPKRPKQKNLCSKMWRIDQLYIELGSRVFEIMKKTWSGYVRNCICFLTSLQICSRNNYENFITLPEPLEWINSWMGFFFKLSMEIIIVI